MINVSQEWKDNIYAGTEKKIKLIIGDVELTDDDIQGKVEIQETCTNAEDIKIGSCIASILKFNVINKGQSIDFLNNNINVQVGIKIPSTGEFEFVPMGIFTVDEVNDKDEQILKVTARDKIKLFDKDCTEFIKIRAYPITLWTLTQQLCSYIGIELENTSIINGSYVIEESFNAENITGQQILSWIGEASASFINVNRYGKLVFKTFTIATNSVTDREYINIDIAKYAVPQITRLQIAVQEDDLGVIVGSGNITYSIINNPLLYTKSSEQIIPVANNILTQLQSISTYVPVKAYGKGNPAIETGDIFRIDTFKGQEINVIIMDRKFVYQKSFRDTYQSFGTTAVGEKRIVQNSTLQLKGKMNILTRTLEENRIKVADLEIGYNEIVQTVDELSIEVAEIDLKSIATYYQTETPTSELKIGDIWYNPGYSYLVDNLTMTVNEMTMTVDDLIILYSKLMRWNGTAWEDIKDTETLKNVSELSVRADEILLRVSDAEGDIGALQLTASDLTARITSAEGNIGELELTSTALTTRIESAEGDIGSLQLTSSALTTRITSAEGAIGELELTTSDFSVRLSSAEGGIASLELTTSGLKLAIDNTKIVFDSTGQTIKNGGFRIKDNSDATTFEVSTGGGITMKGDLYNVYGGNAVRLYNGRIDFSAGSSGSQWWLSTIVGDISGYYNGSSIRELIIKGGTQLTLRTDWSSTLKYQQVTQGTPSHIFDGRVQLNNDIYMNTSRGMRSFTPKRLIDTPNGDFVLSATW